MTDLKSTETSVRRGIVFAFALALACYLAWLLRKELVLLYVSGLFAVVLSPLVSATNGFRIGRYRPFKGSAVLLLLLLLVGAIVGFGYLALPPVIGDLQEFGREMPTRLPLLLDHLQRIPLVQHFLGGNIGAELQSFISNTATSILLSIKSWAGAIFDVAMGVILTVYFILEGRHAYAWFLSFIPVENRERLDMTLQRARLRMDKWLVGQGSLMLILGVSSTIMFLLLKVRYAYALGVLIGALNIIPVLGAAIGITLALLSASINSWGTVLAVASFYAIYEWIENSFLVPRIMQNRLNLPGLAVLISLLIGSALAGVLGAMVAVPTAVLISVLLDEYAKVKEEGV
jgi:predicted PurR-regulated permease PerM